jgi:hypothetical protein
MKYDGLLTKCEDQAHSIRKLLTNDWTRIDGVHTDRQTYIHVQTHEDLKLSTLVYTKPNVAIACSLGD